MKRQNLLLFNCVLSKDSALIREQWQIQVGLSQQEY